MNDKKIKTIQIFGQKDVLYFILFFVILVDFIFSFFYNYTLLLLSISIVFVRVMLNNFILIVLNFRFILVVYLIYITKRGSKKNSYNFIIDTH